MPRRSHNIPDTPDEPERNEQVDSSDRHLVKDALVVTTALGMIAAVGVVATRQLSKRKIEGDS